MPYKIRFLNKDLEAAFSDSKHAIWSQRGMPPRTFKAAMNALDKLTRAPLTMSWLYPGREEDLGGLRAIDIAVKGRGRFRIYFKVCEECKNQQTIAERNVLDCCKGDVTTDDKTVNVLFIADPH
jgi:hypothetical protein